MWNWDGRGRLANVKAYLGTSDQLRDCHEVVDRSEKGDTDDNNIARSIEARSHADAENDDTSDCSGVAAVLQWDDSLSYQLCDDGCRHEVEPTMIMDEITPATVHLPIPLVIEAGGQLLRIEPRHIKAPFDHKRATEENDPCDVFLDDLSVVCDDDSDQEADTAVVTSNPDSVSEAINFDELDFDCMETYMLSVMRPAGGTGFYGSCSSSVTSFQSATGKTSIGATVSTTVSSVSTMSSRSIRPSAALNRLRRVQEKSKRIIGWQETMNIAVDTYNCAYDPSHGGFLPISNCLPILFKSNIFEPEAQAEMHTWQESTPLFDLCERGVSSDGQVANFSSVD